MLKVISDQTNQIALLTAEQINIATDIEFKQNQLESIEQATTLKIRETNADLALSIKENEDEVLKTLLKNKDLVAVPPSYIEELKEQINDSKSSLEDAIKSNVNAATTAMKTDYESTIAALVAEHKIEIAQLNANATSYANTIELLQNQVADARKDLAEEREVRVKTEEARSRANGVVVNTTK